MAPHLLSLPDGRTRRTILSGKEPAVSVTGNDPSSVPGSARPARRRRIARRVLAAGLLVLGAIQFVPFGRAHTNPQATARIPWDSPRTEALVRGACFDCHSHETRWPWYSHIAPVSWLVESDVLEGRQELNFSVGKLDELHEASEMVREGDMPPWFYRPLHAGARLSTTEKDELIAGLAATFGTSIERGNSSEEEEHDDD